MSERTTSSVTAPSLAVSAFGGNETHPGVPGRWLPVAGHFHKKRWSTTGNQPKDAPKHHTRSIMADAISVSGPISGTDRTLTFETGKLAQLADGAVLARIGDTVLLATATAARSVREGTDFFPLTVDIEERT